MNTRDPKGSCTEADPALAFMTLDIASKVMSLVDDLPQFGNLLTMQVRELTGAQVVVLIQCSRVAADRKHHVVSFSPRRRRSLVHSPEFERMIALLHRLNQTQIWMSQGQTSQAMALVEEFGFVNGMGIPLIAGSMRVGAILALGVSPHSCGPDFLELLDPFTSMVALAMQNSCLLMQQEQTIQDRTMQLESSEQTARALLDAPNELAVLYKPEGEILDHNEQFVKRLHIRRKRVVGSNIFDLYSADMSLAHRSAGQRALMTGMTQRFEEKVDEKNYDVTVYPMADLTGEIAKFAVFSKDITQQKLAEDRNTQLEEQLQQAEKMRALGQLAGGIAHDFNNLLAGIVGAQELLKLKVGPDKDTTKYFDTISDMVQRAVDMTQQLTAFARKKKLRLSAVDLHDVIKRVINILTHTIDRRITLSDDCRAERSLVLGDTTQLQNALLNLGVNARDAMIDGGSLSFATECVELEGGRGAHNLRMKAGRYLKISVADTGEGIPEDVIDHIFEPFFTTKGEGKGTGLGLAGVFGSVEAHHGMIEVESKLGQGTCFTIYLPLCEETAGLKMIVGINIQRGHGRILLADDEDVIRDNVTTALTSAGYEVSGFSNGKDAVDYYRDNWAKIDLVLLDVVMPEMDGPQALIAIRRINPKAKVMYITGSFGCDMVQQEGGDEVDGYIQKPFQITQLTHEIARVLATETTTVS